MWGAYLITAKFMVLKNTASTLEQTEGLLPPRLFCHSLVSNSVHYVINNHHTSDYTNMVIDLEVKVRI